MGDGHSRATSLDAQSNAQTEDGKAQKAVIVADLQKRCVPKPWQNTSSMEEIPLLVPAKRPEGQPMFVQPKELSMVSPRLTQRSPRTSMGASVQVRVAVPRSDSMCVLVPAGGAPLAAAAGPARARAYSKPRTAMPHTATIPQQPAPVLAMPRSGSMCRTRSNFDPLMASKASVFGTIGQQRAPSVAPVQVDLRQASPQVTPRSTPRPAATQVPRLALSRPGSMQFAGGKGYAPLSDRGPRFEAYAPLSARGPRSRLYEPMSARGYPQGVQRPSASVDSLDGSVRMPTTIQGDTTVIPHGGVSSRACLGSLATPKSVIPLESPLDATIPLESPHGVTPGVTPWLYKQDYTPGVTPWLYNTSEETASVKSRGDFTPRGEIDSYLAS